MTRREKDLIEQVSEYHLRISWLVHRIVEDFGECPPDRRPGWMCRDEDGCINCWIRASKRGAKELRDEH